MTYYDNNANQIDYVVPHKIEVKRNFTDLNIMSDDELVAKLDEVEIRIAELGELYNLTKREDTFITLSKVSSFRSVIRAHMRKRGLKKNSELIAEIKELKEQLANVQVVKCKDKSEAVIASLKGEVAAYRKKIGQLNDILAENREAEKTKRHKISTLGGVSEKAYLLAMIKEMVSEEELQDIYTDLNEIREREIKELI